MFDDVEKIDAQVAPLAALLDDGEIIVGHVAPIAALLDAFGLQSSQVVRLREQHDLQKKPPRQFTGAGDMPCKRTSAHGFSEAQLNPCMPN